MSFCRTVAGYFPWSLGHLRGSRTVTGRMLEKTKLMQCICIFVTCWYMCITRKANIKVRWGGQHILLFVCSCACCMARLKRAQASIQQGRSMKKTYRGDSSIYLWVYLSRSSRPRRHFRPSFCEESCCKCEIWSEWKIGSSWHFQKVVQRSSFRGQSREATRNYGRLWNCSKASSSSIIKFRVDNASAWVDNLTSKYSTLWHLVKCTQSLHVTTIHQATIV